MNAEQKSPTDYAAMKQQLLASRFFDLAGARAIVASDAFRAGLDDQVRFFVETRQIASPIQLDGLIANTLLAG